MMLATVDTSSTCQACADASKARTYEYRSDCDGCVVRAIASSPEFFDADRGGQVTPAYRKLMQQSFGSTWTNAHQRVKVEAERLRRLEA